MTVSHVARLHGINANQIFKWRRQYEDGLLTAVASSEEVVLWKGYKAPSFAI
jgi:transposase